MVQSSTKRTARNNRGPTSTRTIPQFALQTTAGQKYERNNTDEQEEETSKAGEQGQLADRREETGQLKATRRAKDRPKTDKENNAYLHTPREERACLPTGVFACLAMLEVGTWRRWGSRDLTLERSGLTGDSAQDTTRAQQGHHSNTNTHLARDE